VPLSFGGRDRGRRSRWRSPLNAPSYPFFIRSKDRSTQEDSILTEYHSLLFSRRVKLAFTWRFFLSLLSLGCEGNRQCPCAFTFDGPSDSSLSPYCPPLLVSFDSSCSATIFDFVHWRVCSVGFGATAPLFLYRRSRYIPP